MKKGSISPRNLSAIFVAIAAHGGLSMPAYAQIRVDAPIHSLHDSCASCDLSNKRLNGMKLENANFVGSVFNNSNLSGGEFHGADLTGAHFRKALLYRFEGDAVKMAGAIFEDATLTEARVTNSILHKINLSRANMTRADFSKNDFRAADLTDVKAVNSNFSGSNFESARLNNGNLQDANLTDSNFKNVNFGKAILLGSQIRGANLSGADLSDAQGLSQTQLDTACGDVDTLLPNGLFLPFCEDTETLVEKLPAENQITTPNNTVQQSQTQQDPIEGDPLILGFDGQ